MPRYRVVLEFDHPGEGQTLIHDPDKSLSRSPDHWNWARKIDLPEVTNLNVEVYEKNEWRRLK